MKYNPAYKFAEKCLYEYRKNRYAIKLLRQDLAIAKCTTDVKTQRYDVPIVSTVTPSDPVHSRVVNIEQIEKRITKLERVTKPITRLKKELSKAPELLEVLTNFYFGGVGKAEVLKKLGISQAEFYRRRKRIIFFAMDFLQIFAMENEKRKY